MLRLLMAIGLSVIPAATRAEPATAPLAQRAQEAVEALAGKREAADVFDDRFLAEVPPAQFQALGKRLQAESGPILAAEGVQAEGAKSATFTIRFERAVAQAHITLGPAPLSQVSGLRVGAALPIEDSPAKLMADFAALPGRTSFALVRLDGNGPATVLASHADERLAVGSAFKLWVLDALARDVADGRHRWDEVVPLGSRSLPHGISQDWPVGAAVTVETLATLMISLSDNTATDTLIGLIGRDRIAVPSPPLLTTAEAFALKLGPDARRTAYLGADAAERLRLIAAIDAPAELAAADTSALDGAPIAIESAEWFASAKDIAGVLDSLRRRPDPRVTQILGIEPHLDTSLRGGFSYVGYKGGSEIGVLNLSWLVRNKAGAWFAVTASWNDSAARLDDERLEALAQRLLRMTSNAP